jgi:protoporphyrinogen oxidase
MSKSEHVPVVILGGGLTGLSAGLECERRSITYRVLEKSDRVGGHAVTTEENGYRFDRTGHLLHLRSEALKNEVLDWLEGDCVSIERRSVVFSHGATTRYPFQSNTLGLPPEVAYECLMGFLSTLSAPKPGAPRNFEEFCLAHFGPGFSRHFMLPYNTKLWGVPAREITPAWCQRFVPIPKLEDVIAGAVGLADRKLGYNANFLYPRRGIGALPTALARRVKNVTLSRAPRQILGATRELVFEHERIGYDALISTAPLPTLLSLFDRLPAEVEAARGKLRCTPLYYLDIALDCPVKTDFHWAYVPEEKYPFYRVGCYSHFSPQMAPAGKANLYVELATREPPELESTLDEVGRGLVEMGVIDNPSQLAFARLRRLDHAYVIYDHDYEASLGVIRPFLESMRVISTGRYGGWNYSSMEDALLFGREAVENVNRFL